MSMEFLRKNLVNTTTQFTIANGTATVSNCFRRDKRFQFLSDGMANDLTTTSITISFDATSTVSRIGLQECNYKDFTIFYNGATASTFNLSTTANTTVSDWSANDQTSLYLHCNPVACTSVTFDILSTQTADSEKAIGLLYLTEEHFVFGRDPSAKNYRLKNQQKRVEHKMSDGGYKIHNLDNKYQASIKFKYIDGTFRDNLETLYNRTDDFIFAPFGTSTGWDGIMFSCVWSGPFDFLSFSEDAIATGYSGSISLKETSF